MSYLFRFRYIYNEQVTFRDPESARRACADPNPVIDGRRANCNIASLGRPRPSPPRGKLTFFIFIIRSLELNIISLLYNI